MLVFPVAYNVRMQTVNKSLRNQVLNTGILSHTLKIDKVMIYIIICYVSSLLPTISKVLETSLGRQVYLHTSMIDNEYDFIHKA